MKIDLNGAFAWNILLALGIRYFGNTIFPESVK